MNKRIFLVTYILCNNRQMVSFFYYPLFVVVVVELLIVIVDVVIVVIIPLKINIKPRTVLNFFYLYLMSPKYNCKQMNIYIFRLE